MEDDEREEAFLCTYEATHVEEADELTAIVSRVDGSQHSSAVDQLFDRYHKIVRCPTSKNDLNDTITTTSFFPKFDSIQGTDVVNKSARRDCIREKHNHS